MEVNNSVIGGRLSGQSVGMNIISINIRGLGGHDKKRWIRDICVKERVGWNSKQKIGMNLKSETSRVLTMETLYNHSQQVLESKVVSKITYYKIQRWQH